MLSSNSSFFESLHKEQWKEVRLGEVAEFGNGKARPKSLGNIPIYGGNGILGYTDKFNYEGETIIIGRVGAYCGCVYCENKQIWVSDNALIAKPKYDNSTKFLYYLLKHMNLNSHAEGSSQPLITQTLLNNLHVRICKNHETQNQIAEILSSFDDKIDLLHRQNKTLESLALTLFSHTFIDNPNRNDWEEVTLNDICLKIASGGTPSTKIKEYYSGKINWYSTKELDDNFLFDSIQMITESGLENSSAKLFPKDTIIIAIYAAPTVGRLGILTQNSAFNQAACGLIIDETKCSKEFVFCFLKNERENLNLLTSGSSQQNLNVGKIKRYALLLPNKTAFNDFQIQAKGFFNKIYNNAKQIWNLQSMRDMLLAKILNEKMEV